MTAQPVTDDELHAYVDGQLSAERRLFVERWLADDPDAARRAEDYRAQMALLHEIFDPVLREPVEDPVHDLTEKLRGRVAGNDNRPAWHALPWVRSAAAVLLVVAGLGGGWVSRGVVYNSPSMMEGRVLKTFANEATEAHRFYTADERFQVELGGDKQDELNSWVSQRMGRDVFGPDLSKQGYHLVGGRSLPTDLGAGAQYMYVNDANKRVTLFVGAPQGSNRSTFGFSQNGDVATIYWVEDNLAYALAGRQPKEDLLKIAESVVNTVKAGPPQRDQSQGQDQGQQGQQQGQPQQQDQQQGVQPISDSQKPKDS